MCDISEVFFDSVLWGTFPSSAGKKKCYGRFLQLPWWPPIRQMCTIGGIGWEEGEERFLGIFAYNRHADIK